MLGICRSRRVYILKGAVFLICLFLLLPKANAMPWGRVSDGIIITDHNSPALCVPRSALTGLTVDIAYIADARNKINKNWVLRVKQGGKPVFLTPGQCLSYAFVSSEYEKKEWGVSFELEKKYFFSIDSLQQPKTRSEVFSYSAFFVRREARVGG